MKRLFLLAFFLSSFAIGQTKSSYINFFEDEKNIYSCDSLSIKRTNNIVTCRIMIYPTKSSNKKNYFIRQYLLNSFQKKYYVLGEIEYDSTMKVITTNNPKVVNPTEAKAIESDTIVYSLATYLNKILNESVFVLNFTPTKETELKVDSAKIKISAKVDSVIIPVSNPVEIKEEQITEEIITNPPEEIVKEIVPEIAESEQIEERAYNYENEYNVQGTIFSDGALFCYQVSSWKNKNIAEKEMRKLIEKGFNAFIMRAEVGNKKTIWYRVRVGFFNSIDDAIESQKKVNYK